MTTEKTPTTEKIGTRLCVACRSTGVRGGHGCKVCMGAGVVVSGGPDEGMALLRLRSSDYSQKEARATLDAVRAKEAKEREAWNKRIVVADPSRKPTR